MVSTTARDNSDPDQMRETFRVAAESQTWRGANQLPACLSLACIQVDVVASPFRTTH
jgi:hypothetical protein